MTARITDVASRREPRNDRHLRIEDAIDREERNTAEALARFMAEPPRTFPRCIGNCSQGRRLCATPDACRLAEAETPRARDSRHTWTLVAVLAAAALIVGALLAIGWPR